MCIFIGYKLISVNLIDLVLFGPIQYCIFKNINNTFYKWCPNDKQNKSDSR